MLGIAVGTAVGAAVGTVKSQAQEALARLRQRLPDLESDDPLIAAAAAPLPR